MQELTKNELKKINGGGFGTALLIGTGIVFLIGFLDGLTRPYACRA